jgi:hypothetical protein
MSVEASIIDPKSVLPYDHRVAGIIDSFQRDLAGVGSSYKHTL